MMDTELAANVRTIVDWDFQDTTDHLSTPADKAKLELLKKFADGTGANQANLKFSERRILTANTGTDLLDFAGGLTDKFGNTITFSEIKLLFLHNKGLPGATNDGSSSDTWTEAAGQDLLVGGAASNAWDVWLNETAGAEVRVRSGGILLLCAPRDGYRVIAGTDDILQVLWDGSVASGGDIEYDIVLLGS